MEFSVENKKLKVLPPAALAGAGHSETERSEVERSATPAKADADLAPEPHPNSEVVAKARRRAFTADYKLRFLRVADAAGLAGGIGALLRREGLYSSHLVTWRRERTAGILGGLTPHKRGPKSKHNPLEEENQKLRRQNERLTEELRKAEIVIDVQKKVAALLGRPIPTLEPGEKF